MDELVLKGAVIELGVKPVNDLLAYKFLTGFLHPLKLSKEPNYQSLYNSMKHGVSIVGPVVKLMKELEKSESYVSLKAFMMLHEFAHFFREFGSELVAEKVISAHDLNEIREIVESFDNASLNYKLFGKDSRILGLLQNAYEMFQAKNRRGEGLAIARVALEIKNRKQRLPIEQLSEEENISFHQ